MSASPSRRLAESGRVEAFSDGVFAIALTLLVLDLHVPEGVRGDFARALSDQWQSYVAYLAAFLNIASIWISHHDLFTRVRRVDVRLIVANLVLLLVSSLFPFPASVISSAMRDGNHRDQVVACLLYAALGLSIPLAWRLIYGQLVRSPQLLEEPGDLAYVLSWRRKALVSVVVYPIAALVAVVAPVVALIAFVAVPFYFIGALVWAADEG
jgi:uncharacterized membrane protein